LCYQGLGRCQERISEIVTMVSSPVVIVLAGLDPTGGAGLAVDIKAVTDAGACVAPLVTANTLQGPGLVASFQVTDLEFLNDQLIHVIQQLKPVAVKLGMTGSSEIISLIRDCFSNCSPVLPLVFDPVKSASSGGELIKDGMREEFLSLGPLVTLLTPNRTELE
ncbi:bifunctional hydroxymethylpyrimidine kinase/phosphomethylpyrimidine kinase, partial [bacterium]|nr:bifunctional hydroxymethylpyrimidine kinase/phosphomethylpyrimidine kinase [bacterium]